MTHDDAHSHDLRRNGKNTSEDTRRSPCVFPSLPFVVPSLHDAFAESVLLCNPSLGAASDRKDLSVPMSAQIPMVASFFFLECSGLSTCLPLGPSKPVH